MTKSKKSLSELAVQADKISIEIENSFAKVILKDEAVAQKTAMNIVMLVAHIEEIFNRIHQKVKGNRVSQKELIQAIKELGVSEYFIMAFEKLKILRNRIVHQISFIEPLYMYLSRDLRGLDHCWKMKVRMRTMVKVVHEEVHYAT